jgi:hypothetical protein
MNPKRSLITLITALALLVSPLLGLAPSTNRVVAETSRQTATVDLVVENFAYTDGSEVTIGDPIGDQIELSIRNAGSADAGSFSVGYYVSSDSTITTADTLLDGGREFVNGIAAGSTVSVTLFSGASVPSSVSPGPAYLGVVIDESDDVAETDETNNTASQAVDLINPKTESFSFVIDEPHDVPFRLFNVLTPGTIEARIVWEGATSDLTATLTGRRRPSLADPTEPYAQVSGSSPLVLTYDVTATDVARGVGWRLAIEDLSGTNDARGTVELTVPFDAALNQDFQNEHIRLRSGDIWPSSSLQSEFFGSLSGTSREGLHGLISLTQTPVCQDTAVLERQGFVRQTFLGGRNSYGLIEKGADPSQPDVAPLIRAITPLEPEDKIDPHVLLGDYAHFTVQPEDEPEQNYVLNADGSLDLSVLFAQDVTPGTATGILSSEVISFAASSDQLYRATLNPSQVTSLAEREEVEWIEAGPVPKLIVNDVTRNVLNVNAVQNATVTPGSPASITYNGLTGSGITVGVHDNGVDATHQDLNVVADQPGGAPHGTHVAGTVAGSGVRSDKNNSAGNANGGTAFQWRGMAPNAAIIDGGDPTNASALLNHIQNNSLDLTNHSHILGVDGAYNNNNRQTDQIIRGGTNSGGTLVPRRPVVFAAANNGDNGPQYGNVIGHYSLLNQMKNTIVVAGWAAGPNRLYTSSSLGPAYDGRLKPDVTAPGAGITSAGVRLNERQRVQFSATPTTGSYTLSFSGQTTPPLNYNATVTTVQNALTSLSSIGANNVNVGGGPMPGTPLEVTFQNALNNSDQPQMTASGSGLDNGATVQVVTRWNGYQTDGYQTKWGTSMAAPAVSGIVALTLEAWQNTYASPLGTNIDDNPPFPSTLRAILIQTANDIVRPVEDANGNGTLDPGEDLDGDGVLDLGVRPNLASSEIDSDSNQGNGNDGNGFVAAPNGPDYATGWGMADAQAAVNLVQDSRMESGNPVPNRIVQDAATQAETDEYDFVVDSPGNVKVTLAWDDVESAAQNPASSQRLVNDLDLVLEAPDGTIYYPWQLGHTIVDGSGNPIPPQNQTPGTNINVQLAHTPSPTPSTASDYIPQNIQAGTSGGWIATRGRDHLNNVEQVFVDVPSDDPGKIGHWTARVTGFNVRSGSQDYSLVGMPYPDRPDLVAFSDDKAGIPAFGNAFDVTWKYSNVGQLATDADTSPGTFEYKIWLSDDFFLDGSDVKLVDSSTNSSLSSLGPLSPGSTGSQTSTITIAQGDADTLLGTSGVSFSDFMDTDPFILLELDSEEEILEHKETNVAPLQMARITDVVLVMDRSGSMSGNIPVSAGSQTKLAVLKDSAKLFLDLMRKGAGDRLGEVSFNASANVLFDDGSGNVTSFSEGTVNSAKNQVDGLSAGGQTDIRDGLDTGLGMIPTGNDRRRVIIFFSDGEKTDGGDPTESSFLQNFTNKDVKIFSVGFGTKGASGYAGLDIDLLETLANTGDNGFYHVTQEPTGLDKFFVNAVAGAVDSEVVVDPVKDIVGGGTEVVDVDLSSQASVVSFVLTWDNPGADLDLSLIAPGGTRITPANASSFGDRVARETAAAYEILTLHLPLTGSANQEHGGAWKMEVSNSGSQTVEFSASAIAESTVNAESAQPPQPDADGFNPGDSVDLGMNISQQGGNPVGTASVTVVPEKPVVGIGDLLSSGAVSSADLAGVPNQINGEDLSLRERMIIALQNKLGRNPIPRRQGTPFSLGESGSGVYAGSFTETGTPGPYSFTMHAEALAEDCSPISRETIQTVGVSPHVDAGTSTVVITSRGDGSHTVTVTPRGSRGNYLGPGYADAVKITPDSSALVPVDDVQDQLDGSYTQTFNQTAEVGVVTIDITVMGVPLSPVRVDTGSPTPGSITPVGGSSGSSKTVTIGTSGGSVSLVTGVNMIYDGTVVPLQVTGVDEEQSLISATVPSDVVPGLYRLQFETKQGEGRSSLSALATYRVVGQDQQFPANVESLRQGLEGLLSAETQDGVNTTAQELLRRLHQLTPDRQLTGEDVNRAAEQVANVLAGQSGPVTRDLVPGLDDVLNLSMIDARFVPASPVTTPQGEDVGLDLGNGVQVNFGLVNDSGQTQLQTYPGPNVFSRGDRGQPHVTYDVSTTASVGSSQGIDVVINYREGDFGDESQLRIFHWEGEWQDRTAELDTQGNRIRARVDSLSPFVLATGEPTAPSPTIFLPIVLR